MLTAPGSSSSPCSRPTSTSLGRSPAATRSLITRTSTRSTTRNVTQGSGHEVRQTRRPPRSHRHHRRPERVALATLNASTATWSDTPVVRANLSPREIRRALLPAHRGELTSHRFPPPGQTHRADQGVGVTGEGPGRTNAGRQASASLPGRRDMAGTAGRVRHRGMEPGRRLLQPQQPVGPGIHPHHRRQPRARRSPRGYGDLACDAAPTGGHHTKGWRQIIEAIASAPWWQADPDTIDPPVPDR